MSKVRNTEVWHGQLLVISNDWDVKGLVVKVCRVSIGIIEIERERERERERVRERERERERQQSGAIVSSGERRVHET